MSSAILDPSTEQDLTYIIHRGILTCGDLSADWMLRGDNLHNKNNQTFKQMNLQFMKRSLAQCVNSPLVDGRSIAMASPAGFGLDGRAATCTEVRNSNPPGVRESNRVSNWVFRMVAMLAFLLNGSMLYADSIAGVSYRVVSEEDGTCEVSGIIYSASGVDSSKPKNVKLFVDSVIEKNGKHYKVISIGEKAFYENRYISTVVISNGIRTIGDDAFAGSSIDSITLPNSITELGKRTFRKSNLRKIKLSENIKVIPEEAFYETKIEEIQIPDNLKIIYDGAFEYCTINSITLPNSITKLGKKAFSYSNLRKIKLSESIKIIHEETFRDTKIEHIQIPESVTELREYCFYNCENLKSTIIPNTIKEIPQKAFSGCNRLDIKLPESIEKIYSDAFSGVLFVRVNENIKHIEEGGFRGCGLPQDEIYLPNLEVMEPYAFSGSTLKSIVIGNKLKSISDFAFRNCKRLYNITFSNSIESIGESAFEGCSSLKNITFPNWIKTIDRHAFDSSGIEEMILPKYLERIGCSIWRNCKNLKKITIPGSVKTIVVSSTHNSGDNKFHRLFDGCENLDTLIFETGINKTVWDKENSYDYLELPKSLKYFSFNSNIGIGLYQDSRKLKNIHVGSRCTQFPIIELDFYSAILAHATITFESATPPTPVQPYGILWESLILYVPNSGLDNYVNSSNWGQCPHIIGYGNGGNNSVNSIENSTGKRIINIYKLDGQHIDNNHKGLVIVEYSDGTIEKIIQK